MDITMKYNYLTGLLLSTTLVLTGCSGSSDSSDDTVAPVTTIDFPSTSASSSANALTVRGRASDTSGIAAVNVNGFEASSSDGFATWQVTVPLQPGDNLISLQAIDRVGNITTQEGVTTITQTAPAITEPAEILQDNTNNRLLVVTGAAEQIFSIDLSNGEHQLLVDRDPEDTIPRFISPSQINAAYDAERNQVLITCSNELCLDSVIAINLASGARTQLTSLDTAETPANEVAVFPFQNLLGDIVVDSSQNLAYLLQPATNRSFVQDLVALDLTNGQTSIVANDIINTSIGGPSVDALQLDSANNRVLAYFSNPRRFSSIDLSTGVLSDLAIDTSAINGVLAITHDPSNNRLLIIDRANQPLEPAQLRSADLASGTVTNLAQLTTSVTDEAILEPNSNQLFLINDNESGVLQFSLDNSAGGRLASTGRGQGNALEVAVESLVSTGDNQAYLIGLASLSDVVIDQATSINLNTGDRDQVFDPASNLSLSRVALDTENNRLISINRSSEALTTFDLGTQQFTSFAVDPSITEDDPTSIASAGDLALNSRNNQAIILVPGFPTRLVAIDLTTEERSLAIDPFSSQIGFASTLAIDESSQQAFTISASPIVGIPEAPLPPLTFYNLDRVDLESGEVMPIIESHSSSLDASDLVIDNDQGVLYMLAGRELFTLDLATLTPSEPVTLPLSSPTGMSLSQRPGSLLFFDAGTRAVVEFDTTNQQTLIVSQ